MNKYDFLFTTVATRDGRTREVEITDNTEESAFVRLSRMNQYWTIDKNSMKKKKIDKKNEQYFV